jgi:hypothetical protein
MGAVTAANNDSITSNLHRNQVSAEVMDPRTQAFLCAKTGNIARRTKPKTCDFFRHVTQSRPKATRGIFPVARNQRPRSTSDISAPAVPVHSGCAFVESNKIGIDGLKVVGLWDIYNEPYLLLSLVVWRFTVGLGSLALCESTRAVVVSLFGYREPHRFMSKRV